MSSSEMVNVSRRTATKIIFHFSWGIVDSKVDTGRDLVKMAIV